MRQSEFIREVNCIRKAYSEYFDYHKWFIEDMISFLSRKSKITRKRDREREMEKIQAQHNWFWKTWYLNTLIFCAIFCVPVAIVIRRIYWREIRPSIISVVCVCVRKKE